MARESAEKFITRTSARHAMDEFGDDDDDDEDDRLYIYEWNES